MQIQYVSHMGSDDMVVDAARVSFAKAAEKYTKEQNEKLIKYLAKHEHWSPFAHPQIQFRLKVPFWLARQSFKHIVGSVKNEISRRYVKTDPEVHMPLWRNAPEGSIKQGSGEECSSEVTAKANEVANRLFNHALDTYDELLELGVAPEQARAVLPMGTYTEYVDTGSLYYWARVYKQRTGHGAQKDWSEITDGLNFKMLELFPISWKALTE